jgi:hypothetical protein
MASQGNVLSYIALLAWFPITFWLFSTRRLELATAISMFGGAIFLPEIVAINLPLVPDLNKHTIPTLAVLLSFLFVARARDAVTKPLRRLDWLLWLCLFGDVGTWLTNQDVVFAAPPKPALTWYDAASTVLDHVLTPYLMFCVGCAVYRGSSELRSLLRICLVLGLVYTVPCVIELKMSPQLHNWVYGFMQHQFAQTIRGGGYRPMVFMSHGLVLARFMLAALLCGIALARVGLLSGRTRLGVAWLALVFVACKSTGAILLGLVAAPLTWFASSKLQLRAAQTVALIVALYPVLRAAEFVPVEEFLNLSADISEDRAGSLGTRFENEQALLAKARERIAFGWGGYGRSRVYHPETGEDLSITDGEWIIVLGDQGVTGFVAWYGFYLIPIFVAARSLRRLRVPQNQRLLSVLALIAAVFAIDTLPNSSGGLPHFFLSGALYGAAIGLPRSERLTRLRALRARRAELAAAPG